ncbi:hypothetical protein ACFSE1_04235 [Rhizobium helianthi]|uniref:Uncharacterized protein n=1 Tax=Rhizobium helianthi TaxID=1132695 RepID=A0ABW4M173_9HYPH
MRLETACKGFLREVLNHEKLKRYSLFRKRFFTGERLRNQFLIAQRKRTIVAAQHRLWKNTGKIRGKNANFLSFLPHFAVQDAILGLFEKESNYLLRKAVALHACLT